MSEKTIRTRIDYSDAQRFQIWSAIIEDMDLLGKGYRAYHTHIFESFKKWEAQAIEFQNPKGKSLFLDALKADDLYGFIGRKNQLPKGPKRKLEASKIAVLDAFLKAKFPKISSLPPSGEPPVAHAQMADAFNGLLNQGDSKNHDLTRIVEALDGIFIHSPFFADEELERMVFHMGEPGWGFPLIMVNSRPRSSYCVVHKVFLPIRSEYFEKYAIDSDYWENDYHDPEDRDLAQKIRARIDTKNQNLNDEIEVWSGAGVVVPHDYANPMVTLECILKHRLSGEPDISSLLIPSDYEKLGDPFTMPENATTELPNGRQGVFGFGKSREHFDKVAPRRMFTSDFRDAIFDLKQKLGWEV